MFPFAVFRSVLKSIFFQALGFIIILLLGLALICWLTNAFAEPTNSTETAALHQRYLNGVQLAQQGKTAEALAVFEEILTEEPKAKGSLYWSGFLFLQQGQPEKALPFIDRLIEIDPGSYPPLVLSIEANQALGRDAAVEASRKKLFTLRDGARQIHGLTDAKAYPRERLFKNNVEIDEFFDFQQAPFLAWEAIQRDANGRPIRDVLLAYNPDTKAFLFGENVIENGGIKQFNLYRRLTALPAYTDFRAWAFERIAAVPAS